MKFRENESFFYSFELDASFITPRLGYTYTKQQFVLQHTHKELSIFIDKNIVEIPYAKQKLDRVAIYANSKNEVDEVKEFCNHLIESNHLAHIVEKHLLEKFNLEKFQEGLTKAYESYKLIKGITLNVEASNGDEQKKKPKI